VTTFLLEQELAPLNAQIERVRETLAELEGELCAAEAELETFSADRQRFDALRDICNALARLDALEAGELFWGEVPEFRDTAGHVDGLRSRIARFDEEIRGVQERRATLKAQTARCLEDLDSLYDEIRDAHARDERRKEEFVIERELSPVPYHPLVMPWTGDAESERRFRHALLVSFFFSLILGGLTLLINVPVPVRQPLVAEIPERLAMLVRKEPPKTEPVRERSRDAREEKKPQPGEEKQTKKGAPEQPREKQGGSAPGEPKPGSPGETARKKAESAGILAFKSDFADLMEEVPVAKLGTEARLTKEVPQAEGQAVAQRSLVAMQAQGSSGGIGNAAVSRNLGYGSGGGGNGVGRGGSGGGRGSGRGSGGGHGDGIGDGVGVGRVGSPIAGGAQEARPLSTGPGPARTDEEIQIVFDRYKAALYRIYNTELRKNPTLRGKMLLRLTIEPGGEVSACAVESTDLASPELVAQILDRVRRFNFGPKDDVPATTIRYPIDFLPAG
jgi:uncharacterized membrane protein YgcG